MNESPFGQAYAAETGIKTQKTFSDAYQETTTSEPTFAEAYLKETGLPSIVNADPWTNFTQKAKELATKENFPASVLLGQASLETGRGTSNFAKERNNYFGMNAIDSDPGQAFKYNTPEESISDYINLIKTNPRYSWAYKQYIQDKDPYKLLSNIKASGYATDPNYVSKVSSLPEFKQNLLN